MVPHRVEQDYDARNRLTHVDYPGSEPDTSFTYYPDGKVWTATRGIATWTSTETYPSNRAIDYAPNALGQPTQADSFAHGLAYAANGRLTDLIYGNSAVAR